MIRDDKSRVTVSIPKTQDKKLQSYCDANNLTKSAAISMALAIMFQAGYKVGDMIGQMILDKRVIDRTEDYEDL